MPKKYQLDYFEDVKVLKYRRGSFKKFVVFVFLLAVAFGVVVLADYTGNFIATGHFVSTIFNQNRGTVQYYAVVLSEFDNLESAEEASAASADSGGAGFIWRDSNYKVIANIYKNRNDAEKIVENLSANEISASIYEISYSINKEQKELFSMIDNVFADLYRISTKVEKEKMSAVVASSEINTLKSDVHLLKIKYDTIQDSNSVRISGFLLQLINSLESASLQLICNDNSSYIIRHAIAQTVFCGYQSATADNV